MSALCADASRRAACLALALLAAGCRTLVDQPERPLLYDLGPAPPPAAPGAGSARPLVLAEVEAAGALEGTGIVYRLAYEDGHQLRSYALSRWSHPLPQLVRQRLADVLGRDRVVLGPADLAVLAPVVLSAPVLRLELQEFSQHFSTPQASQGRVRLRATLQQGRGAGALVQRTFAARQPAPQPDAAGGVRALAASLDDVAEQLRRWMDEERG